MDNIRTELKKGVGFTLITDKKFKNDLTYIAFRTGKGGADASSASLLTGVLTCADRKRPSLYAMNRALDALYDAQLNGRVMRSCFEHVPAFYIRTLNNRYAYDGTDIRAGGLGILSDVIFDPYMKNGLLCPSNVESEKKQLADAIRSIKNDRGAYAERRCLCGMFEDEPEFAPKYGTEKDVRALTAQKLTDYYTDTLENAAVEIVTVTGEDGEAAKEYALSVAERLGDRKTGRVFKLPGEFDGTVKRTEESEQVNQSVLCIGCDTGTEPFGKDSQIYAVYDEILGHSATSRLFKNVREKLSLCYYCGTTSYAGLRKTVIRAELDAKNRDRAEEEIFRQLELMKTDLSEDELGDGKRSLCSNCLSGTDSLSFTAAWYLSRALSGAETISPLEYIERIKSVTREQVFAAAAKVRPSAVYFMRGAASDVL
jgi:predicted Zn-dependent peptidase